MNIHNKWRFRSRRIKDKVQVIGNQNQHYPPIPNPTFPLRPYNICLVQEPLVRIDRQIYELLSVVTNRLIRLEYSLSKTLERLERDQYREDNLPGAETLWRQIQLGKAGEFRERESVSRDPTRVPFKNRRGYKRNDPIELSGKPRTIDITQCRYCSS